MVNVNSRHLTSAVALPSALSQVPLELDIQSKRRRFTRRRRDAGAGHVDAPECRLGRCAAQGLGARSDRVSKAAQYGGHEARMVDQLDLRRMPEPAYCGGVHVTKDEVATTRPDHAASRTRQIGAMEHIR